MSDTADTIFFGDDNLSQHPFFGILEGKGNYKKRGNNSSNLRLLVT